MRINNDELQLLDVICDYLKVLEDKKAQEYHAKLSLLLNTLLDRKAERNKFVSERIAQKRKIDKTYAQSKSYKEKVKKQNNMY